MPAQKTPSLLANLGGSLKKAHSEHKSEKTLAGGRRDLPDGIENGVAQLVKLGFEKIEEGNDKGKVRFIARAIVKSPTHHNGVKVEGLATMLIEPLYDTPGRRRKTVDEHYQHILEIVRMVANDVEYTDQFDTPEELEATLPSLVELAPHIMFRTYKMPKQEPEQRSGKWYIGNKGPYKDLATLKAANKFWDREPMVNHDWQGVTDEPVAEAGGSEDVEETVTEEAPDEQVEDTPAEDTAADDNDLDALASAADDQEDAEAAAKLKEIAIEAGFTPKQVKDFGSWAEAVEAIRAKQGGGEEEATEEEEEEASDEVPTVGTMYKIAKVVNGKPVVNAKTKKPVFLDVEVVKVDKAKKTADVKNYDDDKVIKGVAFDKLITE